MKKTSKIKMKQERRWFNICHLDRDQIKRLAKRANKRPAAIIAGIKRHEKRMDMLLREFSNLQSDREHQRYLRTEVDTMQTEVDILQREVDGFRYEADKDNEELRRKTKLYHQLLKDHDCLPSGIVL